jgi:hypothetical protein
MLDDFGINEMLGMQKALQEKYKDQSRERQQREKDR